MNRLIATLVSACCLATASTAIARPYAGFSGLAAAADRAATAGTNPVYVVRPYGTNGAVF